jgi:hypothetical protein
MAVRSDFDAGASRLYPALAQPTGRGKFGGAPWFVDLLFISFIPFMQLGLTYYASFATLIIVLMLFRLKGCIFTGARAAFWALFLPFVIFIPLVLTPLATSQDWLRTGRELLIAVLFVFVYAGVERSPIVVRPRFLITALTILVLGLLALTIVQYIALAGRVYIGFPKEAYIQGEGTIAGSLSLYYSKLRPAATFSEPSYLAFILLSAMMVALTSMETRRSGFMLLVLAIIAGALCQSASFALFASIIVTMFLLRTASILGRLWLILGAVMGMTFLLVAGAELQIFTRLAEGATLEGDRSVFIRFFGPLQIVLAFLFKYPMGLPISILTDRLVEFSAPMGVDPASLLTSAAFNFLFQYGVFGILLLVALVTVRGVQMKLYIIACMSFNGSYLAIDKFAVIGMTLAFCAALRGETYFAQPKVMNPPARKTQEVDA